MRQLSFKEAVGADLRKVFLNAEEFAALHTIRYDGQVYRDISVSLQEAEEIERTHRKDDNAQGFYLCRAVLFCAREALGGRLPEQGTWLEISSEENPDFFDRYRVGAASCEMGMLRVELEAAGQ